MPHAERRLRLFLPTQLTTELDTYQNTDLFPIPNLLCVSMRTLQDWEQTRRVCRKGRLLFFFELQSSIPRHLQSCIENM
jgi:hypothetical protein